MIVTSFEQWKQWADAYSHLPYMEKISIEGSDRIFTWEQAWRSAADCAFVLESGKAGRYSFLGLNPASTLKGKGHTGHVLTVGSGESVELHGAPLELVKQWMMPYRSPRVEAAPKFIGGCVGYWGYDVIRSIENIPTDAADDLPFPDYYFMRMDELWIIDHLHNELYYSVHVTLPEKKPDEVGLRGLFMQAQQQVIRMNQLWEAIVSEGATEAQRQRHASYYAMLNEDKLLMNADGLDGIQHTLSKEQYMQAVERVQQYIRQGDVFQVNLSVRQSRALYNHPADIYEWLRIVNPSPFMSYMQFPDFHIVSASPELLVKLEGTEVSTRPIAGTRPRGINEAEDRRLADQLFHNDKERAEHVMLVDLVRNDLGRVSQYGTVKVEELMVNESYSHVMHLVSAVNGELAEGKDVYDIIAATFPGGTITGAPKIRTMEIIEELEPTRRGPYTGSIGWIDYNGNMEFNIVIRTLLAAAGIGYIQAGAGIVIDSNPEQEYEESLNKAKALWKAIQYSERMMDRAVNISD